MRVMFDNIIVDTDKRELWKDKELVPVEPQVFALIIHLIIERHRVVSKDELIEVVWEGRFISDSAVSSRIKSARRALGDSGRTQQFIKTLHGTGFRFVATVEEGAVKEPVNFQTEEVEDAQSVPPNDDTGAVISTSSNKTSPPDRRLKPAVLGLIAAGLVFAAIVAWNASFPHDNRESEAEASRQASSDIARSRASESESSASIAVLPFDDFSQAGDQGYFADGIAEEILNVLAQVEGLRVTSRTSAFAFKGRDASMEEIVKALGVSHVLEGSVRKSGTTLRITAQLIDARSDKHVWSHTYERALSAENIFAVQDEISQAIVTELQGRINIPIINRALQTVSTEAYDAYLRGRALITQRTAQSVIQGIANLNRAATLDPGFAPAQTALVEAYVLAFSYAGLSNEDAGAFAETHAERALILAPDAPETLIAKGRALAIFDGDEVGAIDYYGRALAANPNLADAHRFLGLAQSNLLRIDDAKVSFETARRLDPLAPVIFANLLRVYWDKGDLDAMLSLGEESLQLHTDSIFARRIMGGALRESGNYAAAHRLFKDNEALYGGSLQQLGVLYHHIGRDDLAAPYADADLEALIALLDDKAARAADMARGGSGLFDIAILRWAGESEVAFRMIKKDIALHNLLSPDAQIAVRDQTYDIFYTDILSKKGDPSAAAFRAKLSARFDGKQPADFQLRDSLYAGALWSMLNSDTDAALNWLDGLIDAGHVWPEIAIEPLFDSIRNTNSFQTRLARLEANAARYRAAIEAQLADPDDAWVTP